MIYVGPDSEALVPALRKQPGFVVVVHATAAAFLRHLFSLHYLPDVLIMHADTPCALVHAALFFILAADCMDAGCPCFLPARGIAIRMLSYAQPLARCPHWHILCYAGGRQRNVRSLLLRLFGRGSRFSAANMVILVTARHSRLPDLAPSFAAGAADVILLPCAPTVAVTRIMQHMKAFGGIDDMRRAPPQVRVRRSQVVVFSVYTSCCYFVGVCFESSHMLLWLLLSVC